MKTQKKRFDLLIENAGDKVSDTFELDKHVTGLKGLLLTSDRDDLMYFRGSQRIEVNGEEIFPENYESKLLMSGINVTPQGRYYDLGNMPPGNGQIKVAFQDNASSQAAFTPYRVSLYVDCYIE